MTEPIAIAAVALPGTNVFARPWTLDLGLPDFAAVRHEDIGPAVRAGMAVQRSEWEAVASDEAEPTIANTVEALERSGELLDRVLTVLRTLTSATHCPDLDELEEALAPELSAHNDAYDLDTRLYRRFKALDGLVRAARETGAEPVDADGAPIDEQTARLIRLAVEAFERDGVALTGSDADRLREINSRLTSLTTRFGTLAANAMHAAGVANFTATPDLVTTEPHAARIELLTRAMSRGLEGEYDTRALVVEIARLRAERAALLGYPHHAAVVAAESAAGPGDSSHPDHAAGHHVAAGSAGSVGQDLADILSGDTVTVPAVVDLDEEPAVAEAGHPGGPDSTDGSSAGERAVAALAGGVDILGGSNLSGGSGSAASAGSAPSDAPLGDDRAPQTGEAPSHPGSRTRMGRRSRAAHSQPETPSAAPAAQADASPDSHNGGPTVRAAQAWSTVAPNESRTEAPTGAVPLVSWEPLRGSADGLDPVAEALGGDPSKSLQVQETAELAAVAASLGKPTQIVWQRLRRGIYHEAILSVEGVITLSDGRSFTDPTSAANAAQAVTDADGWRVWRVGVHGAHLGDLRDDLADRGF